MAAAATHPLPLIDRALVDRLDRVQNAFNWARYRTARALPGNPGGIEQLDIDGAQAIVAVDSPFWWMNGIRGLRARHLAQLDELVAPFRRHQRPFNVFVAPPLEDSVARALHALGLRVARLDPVWYGRPPATPPPPPPGGITVQEVGADQAALVQRLYVDGFQFPETQRAAARTLLPVALDDGGARLYLAHADGEPAAMGILYVHERVGYLAGGATLPRFRRRGIQTALIHTRLAAAHHLGCELVCTRTEFATPSQHNMERAGLRLAFFVLGWFPPDAPD